VTSTAPASTDRPAPGSTFGVGRLQALFAASLLAAAALCLLAPSALASKQVVDYFGSAPGTGPGSKGGDFNRPRGIDVNQTGAGGVPAGTIYVADSNNDRIERFTRDRNGTPANPYDDTYPFVSAWGAGVSTGGSDYEICTVAADCRAGAPSGGNGTLAGDGALDDPEGIAIDSDTGEVFVSDRANNRVSIYAADGTFLRSFGYDVVASGPDDTGTGYELCVAANGDVCKAGTSGAGAGQIGTGRGIAVSQPDGSAATGTVFLADSGTPPGTGNCRVDTYALDGTSPGSFGSGDFTCAFTDDSQRNPAQVAVDSRGIVYASNSTNDNEIERYDTTNADGGGVGFLAPIPAGVDEIQQLTVAATAGAYRLSFDPDGAGPAPPETTADIPFDAPAKLADGSCGSTTVCGALQALPSLGLSVDVALGGGPGDATGSHPYTIRFGASAGIPGSLSATDVPQLAVLPGSTPLSGGAGASVATTTPGQSGLIPTATVGLAVDPGPGPDTDVLYAARTDVHSGSTTQQFGPANPPGLASPPTVDDARHATNPEVLFSGGVASDQSDGRLYLTGTSALGFASQSGHGVYVLDQVGTAPTATLDSCDPPTATSVTCHATIDPNGPPLLSYHLEYSTDGSTWTKTPDVPLGTQDTPQSVSATLNPPPAGLEPDTHYFVRLAAAKKFSAPILTAPLQFDTLAAPPDVETDGAPIRTTTTAYLNGRVNPRNSATSYHFEYGTQGPCDANPCTATPGQPAGSGDLTELATEKLTGLAPGTAYHYRVVADNGAPGSPAAGADRTVTTRASDTLSHGHFPGPPNSDRAWELVSAPDTGGNPTLLALGISNDGDRALYSISGGTPDSPSGTFASQLLAHRTDQGWQSESLVPRSLYNAPDWFYLPDPALGHFIGLNTDVALGTQAEDLWRILPGGPDTHLSHNTASSSAARYFDASPDLTRVTVALKDSLDPAHPADSSRIHLYDVSDASPHLLDLLPGGAVPACGIAADVLGTPAPPAGLHGFYFGGRGWISADGSLAYFPSQGDDCSGPIQVYLRDISNQQTTLISGPPVSGPSCTASFIRGTPGAAFFATSSRLTPDDVAPQSCSGSGDADVYRYDLADHSLDCLTCRVPGLSAEVFRSDNTIQFGELAVDGVSRDGSALYFQSPHRLLAGAPSGGAIYRLGVASHELDYVAPTAQTGNGLHSFSGDALGTDSAVSADGQVLVFRSADPRLDPLGDGTTNAGTDQYYRYDHRDGTLVCVSCPLDGSAPRADVPGQNGAGGTYGIEAVTGNFTYNGSPLSADGQVFAFNSDTPLGSADQNTAAAGQQPDRGADVYEWRDGRTVLVSDGLTDWEVGEIPEPASVGASGRDLFFFADAAYTPDALDDYRRLYDARLGGGIDFPEPPPPCPLEACQGNPAAPPADQPPTTTLPDSGNQGRSRGGTATPTKHRCKKHHKCRRKGRRT
jgi:hypothetical protein